MAISGCLLAVTFKWSQPQLPSKLNGRATLQREQTRVREAGESLRGAELCRLAGSGGDQALHHRGSLLPLFRNLTHLSLSCHTQNRSFFLLILRSFSHQIASSAVKIVDVRNWHKPSFFILCVILLNGISCQVYGFAAFANINKLCPTA